MDSDPDEEASRSAVLAVASGLVGGALERVDVLRPWTWRCREVSGRTVVVKRSRLPPGEKWDRTGTVGVAFLNDVAGMRFFGSPVLVGADLDAGVLVMEDLGSYGGLDGPLLRGTAEEATAGVLAWAEALGALHAVAAGRRDEYEAIRNGLAPMPKSGLLGRVAALREVLTGLGLEAPVDELTAALDPRDDGLDTWVHRDPCPDNVLLMADQARIVDFEFGVFGPAGQDAAFLRMGMPTCWCAGLVPDPVVDAAEDRYRQAAVVGLPLLADDRRWEQALTDGAALHFAMTLLWHLGPSLVEDAVWGEATHRERVVTRLERFAATRGGWSGLRRMAEALGPLLAERWGPVGLKVFPAFHHRY